MTIHPSWPGSWRKWDKVSGLWVESPKFSHTVKHAYNEYACNKLTLITKWYLFSWEKNNKNAIGYNKNIMNLFFFPPGPGGVL